MNEFLRLNGASIVSAAVGLILVLLGLLLQDATTKDGGFLLLGIGGGVHANARFGPIKTEDAIAHLDAHGIPVGPVDPDLPI